MDLTRIDEEIQLLSDIKRIMSNPRAAALITQMLTERNGHVSARTPQVKKAASTDLSTHAGNDEYGAQTRAVRSALADHKGRFFVATIGDAMRAKGSDITNVAVGRVLNRLAANGEIRIVTRGKGSNPNKYTKTTQFNRPPG